MGSPDGSQKSPTIASSLFRGTLLYGVSNLGTKGLNFLLLPIYTYYLTPAQYGVVNLAETVAVIVAIFSVLAMPGALSRLYFNRADEDSRAVYVSSVLRSGLGVAVLSVVAALLVGPFVLRAIVPEFSVAFFPFVALAIVAAVANQWTRFRLTLYQVRQKAGRYAALSLAGAVLSAAAALILVIGFEDGARGMLLGKAIGAVSVAAVALFLLRRWLTHGFDREAVRETLAFSLPLIPHQFNALILAAADRFILEHYLGVEAVGIYSVGYTLGSVMGVVTATLMLAWSPIFYRMADGEKPAREALGRTTRQLFCLLALIALIGSVAASYFVEAFMDPKYRESQWIVSYIIFGLMFHGLFSLLQLQVLQAGKTRLLALLTAVASLLNVVLNIVLIPRFGVEGAAAATVIAYAVETLVIYVIAQRLFALPFGAARIVAASGLYFFVFAALQLSRAHDLPPFAVEGAAAVAAAGIVWLAGDMRALYRRLAQSLFRK